MGIQNNQISKKILLVDDSLLSSKITSHFLSQNGFVTESVATGEEAIQKAISSSRPDLILMDIELAGKTNGIDAAHEIIKHVNTPIVFYTANASMDIINKIKEISAYGYVLKGQDKIGLLSTVELALNLYEANRKIEYSHKQYLDLAENAPIGFVKCDYKGDIVFVNQKAIEILNSPSIEETKKFNLLTAPDLVNYGLSMQLEECLQNNKPGVYEMKFKSIWGKSGYLRFHIRPLTDSDMVFGAQIIIDDITEKKRLEDELRALTLTDPLTNIYNRRFFIQKIEDEIARIKRQGEGTFSLAMLDIDDFKAKNDCFGHNHGDIVLKRLTETIKNRIRKTDCLARWGGEEFVIFIQGTQVDQALILVEELRKSISEMEFYNGDKVTASFGVTEYHLGDTIDSLLQEVDSLMYEGKSNGKNCVCSQHK